MMDGIWASLLGQYTYNPWDGARRELCERCPQPIAYEQTRLCRGCITANLCAICKREYETHPRSRELMHAINRASVAIDRAIHIHSALDSEATAALYTTEMRPAADALFEFTVAWLQERPARNGKTKADIELERMGNRPAERKAIRERLSPFIASAFAHENGRRANSVSLTHLWPVCERTPSLSPPVLYTWDRASLDTMLDCTSPSQMQADLVSRIIDLAERHADSHGPGPHRFSIRVTEHMGGLQRESFQIRSLTK